jgi:hypothetical protein
MGLFAGSPNIGYHLLFLDQGKQTFRFPFSVCRKQTEICHFCFPFAANKRKFQFSVYIYIATAAKGKQKQQTSVCFLYKYIIYIYIYAAISNGKRKFRRFSLICLPFAHHISFDVCPFVYDETRGR